LARSILLLAGALALTGCGPKPTYIDHGFIRLPARPGAPAAGYFTVHGGSSDMTLVSVNCADAIQTTMHESVTQGGMAEMKDISSVAVPAGKKIAFSPGGRHLMLYHLNPGIKPGRMVPLLFTFSDATRLQLNVPVIAAGDPAPKD
jgi:periplasmic copper chaperone A